MLGGTHQGLSLIPALICLAVYIAVIVALVFALTRRDRPTTRGGETSAVEGVRRHEAQIDHERESAE